MALGKKKKDLLEQKGYPFVVMDGEVFDYSTNEDIGIETLYQMQKDETISAATEFFSNMVATFIGDFSHEDENIEKFVKTCLMNMERNFVGFAKEAIQLVLKYGWCGAEIIWDVTGNQIVIKDIVFYDVRGMSFQVEGGNITGVYQYSPKGKVEIPIDKMFVFRLGNGIYGESRLKKVYRLWRAKTEFLKSWAIALEKFAVPIVWGKTRNAEVTLPDGTKKNSIQYLHETLKDFHRRTQIATDIDTEIQYLTTGIGGTHFSKIYIDALEYINKLIFRNFMLPNLLLGSEQTGSYSLGNVHYVLFKNAAKSLAQQFVNTFIDQVIYRLLTYNFGKLENYGEFTLVDELSPEERERLSKVLVNLVNAGFVDPVEDEALAKNMLKLPG